MSRKSSLKLTRLRVSKKEPVFPEPESMCRLRKPGPLEGYFKVTSRYILRRMKSQLQCVRVGCYGGPGQGASFHVDLETFHTLFVLVKPQVKK